MVSNNPASPAPLASPAVLGTPGVRASLPPVVLDPPAWLVIAISALLISPIVAAIWLTWSRRPAASVQQPISQDELAQPARQALAELHAGGDVRATVLRCYREMSSLLRERRGLRRGQTMTAREFEQHLAQAGVHNEHIRRLTQLFERVRYGANTPQQRDTDEAVRCLTAIVQAYGRKP